MHIDSQTNMYMVKICIWYTHTHTPSPWIRNTFTLPILGSLTSKTNHRDVMDSSVLGARSTFKASYFLRAYRYSGSQKTRASPCLLTAF